MHTYFLWKYVCILIILFSEFETLVFFFFFVFSLIEEDLKKGSGQKHSSVIQHDSFFRQVLLVA